MGKSHNNTLLFLLVLMSGIFIAESAMAIDLTGLRRSTNIEDHRGRSAQTTRWLRNQSDYNNILITIHNAKRAKNVKNRSLSNSEYNFQIKRLNKLKRKANDAEKILLRKAELELMKLNLQNLKNTAQKNKLQRKQQNLIKRNINNRDVRSQRTARQPMLRTSNIRGRSDNFFVRGRTPVVRVGPSYGGRAAGSRGTVCMNLANCINGN